MKNIQTKVVLSICTLIILFSCKKPTDDTITLSGKVIDAQTLQPIPNYKLTLNFIDGSRTWGGLNLGSYSNIANATTNSNGEYRLVTNRKYAKDSSDIYKIESLSNDGYFGFSKELNAKNAELSINNSIDIIKVYKRLNVNFYVHHTGINNPNNNLQLNISNGYFNDRRDSFSGSDSLKQNNYEVVPNIKYGITKQGIKNGVRFGPTTDSVIFTNSNNNYNIYY
jgi:hypothetical protein